MTPLASPAAKPEVAEAVRAKLQQAPAPLKLADVAKGLPKPRGKKAADLQDEVRKVLDEEVRLGRAFCHPSGKDGAPRYWARDEKQVLRDKAVELAAAPQPL